MLEKSVAYLRLLNGPRKGCVFVLKELAVFDIGRGEDSQIRIDDERVCKSHARIYRKNENWTFYDLNSDTGSSVNDIKVEKRLLDGGEIIRLGGVEMQFSFEAPQKKGAKQGEPEKPAAEPSASGRAEGAGPEHESPTSQLRGLGVEAPSAPTEPVRVQFLRLTVIDGDKRDIGKEILLDAARECLIGRSANCAIVLSDGKVSRLHCRIEHANGQTVITDLNSANGTVLNGERVSQAVLKAGDYLRLGFTVLSYEKVPEPSRVHA
ncbi:MAG: FHA domain-containing protein [Planctomycetes bacterium]|nr:FHA domain-containing protein [Planctomycetota bacterium]